MHARSPLTRLLPVSLSLVLLAAAPAVAEIDPRCEPSPDVAAVLAELPKIADDCGFDAACARRQEAVLETALEEHPDDLHLHRALQNLWHADSPLAQAEPDEREALVAEYRQRAEERPDDAESLYLYGRTSADPEVERETFSRAVELDPGFPWGHLGLHYVASRRPPAEQDPAELLTHATAFVEICPSQIAAVVQTLRQHGDDELVRTHAARAQSALTELGPERSLERYPFLWETWFSVTPLAEHEKVAASVRKELAEIEALALTDQPAWWYALEKGYEAVGDDEALARLTGEKIASRPCSQQTVQSRYQQWSQEHSLGPEATEDERTAYYRSLWTALDEWETGCDAQPFLSYLRLTAAAGLPDLSDDEILAVVDRTLAAREAGLDIQPAPELVIAELYVERGLRLDRVRPLAEASLEASLEEIRRMLEIPSLPEDMKQRMAQQEPLVRFRVAQVSAQAALGQDDLDQARELSVEMLALTEANRPAEDATTMEEQFHQMLDSWTWTLRSEIAAAEKRPLDAAIFGARALAQVPVGAEDSDEAAEIRDHWLEAGGTEESWQALLEGLRSGGGAPETASEALAARWSEDDTALPEFAAEDLAGKTWRLADFRGKTVFANVWATWCGPCRVELPEVEKLHQRLAARDDVLVVTLNIDANPGLALRYAEKEGFTFPVLLATDLVGDLGRSAGIPRSWVIDEAGVIRREQVGFGRAEAWEDSVVELLEQVAAGESGR